MELTLPTGFLDEEKWERLVSLSKDALTHMVEHGEVPAFVGESMTLEDAQDYLSGWLDRNKATLIEGSVEWLASLVGKITVGDGPEETMEEFEGRLASMTDEQLTALNAMEAADVAEAKRDVIDRRRALVADALDTGKELLRGAVATGLRALMAEIQGGESTAPPEPAEEDSTDPAPAG